MTTFQLHTIAEETRNVAIIPVISEFEKIRDIAGCIMDGYVQQFKHRNVEVHIFAWNGYAWKLWRIGRYRGNEIQWRSIN